ncbi:MAG: bifunctional glutamate N-acetyltransferase/amino-acid acetyltransferase ArgJ [Butyricicoccus pullicaecorum]|nr:bifunctional glutamate N-acetyltransferase/amino-acid acetyltransferase ArgJ [Butyricicoccus pullicaecorum]
MYEIISGGVTAAQGFSAGATCCGIKSSSTKNDTAVIYSQTVCTAAAVYTKNRVQAAPIQVTREHLTNQQAQAIIVNSGNANACAPDGLQNAYRESAACAKLLGIPEADVIVCSTGVIGQRLNIECIEEKLCTLTLSPSGSDAAANAIMTTDTIEKSAAVSFSVGGTTCHLGGICKGSGMIHPNMGTMLCFLTTDCAIDGNVLQTLLSKAVQKSFNRVSVDGDTSTNDTCCILANGLAGNPPIQNIEAAASFYEALEAVCIILARKIAADGEGASRLITCTVSGACDESAAEGLAKAVCKSSLVKAAMFGADANWGRILCAMGYSGESFQPETVRVAFCSRAGTVTVCESGRALDFDETLAKQILSEDEVTIAITLYDGDSSVTAWGCDLTYDYVKINGDYRT